MRLGQKKEQRHKVQDKRVEIVFRYRDEFARAMETAKNYEDRPLPAAV